jgi:hypothetical protein
MIRTLFLSLMLCLATRVVAQEEPGPSINDLATKADLVAVAQVLDTDYQYTRDFPSGGMAFLRVLVPYKVTRPYTDLVEVYEEGLHEHECYFPDPPAGVEGRRYLVFLAHNPAREDQYLGQATGCALEMLVTADNDYALLYPPRGMAISDDLEGLAVPMKFSDRHAVPDNEQLEVEERNRLLEGGWLVKLDDGRFAYTHGISLSVIRGILGEANLTTDRQLLRQRTD